MDTDSGDCFGVFFSTRRRRGHRDTEVRIGLGSHGEKILYIKNIVDRVLNMLVSDYTDIMIGATFFVLRFHCNYVLIV